MKVKAIISQLEKAVENVEIHEYKVMGYNAYDYIYLFTTDAAKALKEIPKTFKHVNYTKKEMRAELIIIEIFEKVLEEDGEYSLECLETLFFTK